MPRRARIAIAGIPSHIIQRGNNRSACFYAPEDYCRYLETHAEMALRYECAIHAHVLMTNHVHLLLSPARNDSASLLMKHLGQRYVQYINRHYRRSGTLWEGRFRSCLAQRDEYVLTCYRYIELNPVRADMVTYPCDYHWSSYRCNAHGNPRPLITPHHEYERLGSTDAERHSAYQQLFTAHIDPERIAEIRNATNGNYVLGKNRFKEEISRMLKRRVTRSQAGRPARRDDGGG